MVCQFCLFFQKTSFYKAKIFEDSRKDVYKKHDSAEGYTE